MADNATRLFLSTLLALAACKASCGVLQDAVDQAPEGAVIELGSGLYEGNVVIRKPLALKGTQPNVVVRGEGKGSVITVQSSFVTIEGLTVENSGGEHQSVDAGITVRDADNVQIRNNTIRNCLFGVNFEKTNKSVIEGNHISSLDASLGLRGDGLRLWYSHNNLLKANETFGVRDNVFWYSSGNRIVNNIGRDSRYSLHFMYADRNVLEHNQYRNNSVGIFLMFSEGSVLRGNFVSDSTGPFGIGIGMKEASNMLVEGNQILYNARGFYLDSCPYQPGTVNVFRGNKINYNTTAFLLHGTLLPSRFEENSFKGNIEDIANDTPESHLEINTWRHNYWDNYQGFDRNGDGFGDIPHEQWMYADRIWNHLPAAKIFYASPILDFMNFLWRLMPFSEPSLLARDESPRIEE